MMKSKIWIAFSLLLGLATANAQKGLVFKFAKEPSSDIVNTKGVEYLVSAKLNTKVLLSIQAHPVSNEDLYVEIMVEYLNRGNSYEVDPQLITIESGFDKDKSETLMCYDPLMLARLYCGEKAVVNKERYLQQVKDNSGQVGVDSVKSVIRIEAAKTANPSEFGLLEKTVLSDDFLKTAGLLSFPMPDKKCTSLRINVPIGNEVHQFAFTVETAKNVTKPHSPLLDHFYKQQILDTAKPYSSALEIMFGANDLSLIP